MMNRILFFATLREKAGARSMDLDLPSGATVGEVKARLAAEIPSLRDALAISLAAVNQDFAADDQPIPDGAEIAFFPPVSGG